MKKHICHSILNLIFIILSMYLFQNSFCFSQNADNRKEQDRTTDSLKTLLKSNIHDTLKLQILSDLNWHYSGTNASLSKEYGIQELKLSYKIGNKKWIAQSYNDIGIANYKLGMLDTALYYYNKSLIIRNTLNNKNLIASSLSKMGVIYVEQGNFNQALESNLKALKIYEEVKNENYLAMTLNNISVIYDKLKNDNKKIEYGEKAIVIHLKNKNDYQAAFCYSNLASAYKTNGNIIKANDYLQKGLSIFVKYNDKANEAAILNEIGINLRHEHKEKEALEYYQKAYDIAVQLNDKLSMALYGHNLSGLYSDLGNYILAEKYSLASLENTEPSNKYQLALNFRLLANLYAFLNNGKKSKYYLDRYVNIKDSIFSLESSGQVAEMETKYQTEKKDKELIIKDAEIVKQQADASKKAVQRNAFVIGFIFILIFSTLLFRMFIQKKKANFLLAVQKKEIEEKNEELNQQNEEIRTQRDEIESQRNKLGEQNQLLEEQKQDITDSITYAKRIQQAVLPDFAVIASRRPEPAVTEQSRSIEGVTKQSKDSKIQQIASPLVRNDEQIDYFILFKPKDIVSGDFYWATKINEWLIVTVADCTGHGVPGAFMSMLGISFLNEIVRKKEVTKASEVLDQLRESIVDALKQKGESGEQKDGMDISFCAINLNTLEMQFAGANNPCWIITNRQSAIGSSQSSAFNLSSHPEPVEGEVEGLFQLHELKGDKMPIGIHTNMQPFTNQIYQLQKDDTIYLMSDGYEDQFGGSNRKKFLAKNLKNLLIANSQQLIADQKQTLETTITEWIGSGEQIDDITVLGIKIKTLIYEK